MATVIGLKSLLANLNARKLKALKDHGDSVIVGYTQAYAIYVHEIERNYRVGRWKFLEEPYKRMLPELKRIIRQGLARGLTMGQALMLAGLRLQRESQKIVPVDTGALKASAFTRRE